MNWKPIDFQGIVSLTPAIVDQLAFFLDEKESQAGAQILHAVQSSPLDPTQPTLAAASGTPHKLSESVDVLGKKIRHMQQNRQLVVDKEDWKKSVEKINAALWEYLETLEECVTELFQQLDLVGLDEWQSDRATAVDAIKEILMHGLDDLRWAFLRLENQMKEYKKIVQQPGVGSEILNKIQFWKTLIDKRLYVNLEKCRKYLGFQFQKFSDRYARYQEINEKVQQKLVKFDNYKAFGLLENETQEQFKKLYSLIRLWEYNFKAKSLPQREPIRALRNLVSPDKALKEFKEYYQCLYDLLFDKSRRIKSGWMESLDVEDLKEFINELKGYREELRSLGATVTKYRDFLLNTDPNPYVRVRLGFPEWVVGPEPHQTKQLLNLNYDIENLDVMYETFQLAMERKKVMPDTSVDFVKEDVNNLLHEMSQPLISRQVMKVHADRLVNLLEQLDELTTSRPETVHFIGESLSKAMRFDWKYHVLFDLSTFHSLYTIHHHLVGHVTDRHHLNRLNKFKKLIQQIEQWVENNDTPRHTHEIELDMNDMKGYLQDFLAQVQRLCKSETADHSLASQQSIREIEIQLLEYRYLFGNFFHHLRENRPEEKMIRNQFLFVDQYFEAVENMLHELHSNNH